jgi:mannose-6-phosphate isomerase-like protein (cupin superfamily)
MVRVVSQDEARMLTLPGRRSREILSGATGAMGATLRLVEIAPPKADEKARGPHVHQGFEECIYVVSGVGSTETETGDLPVAPGDCVLVSPGELHVTRNTGDAPLVLLCFFPEADIGPQTREFSDWDEAKATR